MYDIHTHILPNMDDGASDIDVSEQMVKMESEMQVTRLAFTPHFYPDTESLEKFIKRREESLNKCRNSGILSYKDISFRIASETYFSKILFIYESIDSLCYEGTKNLLLELPYDRKWSDKMYTYIERLIDYYTVRPIVAHIERYIPVQKNLRIVEDIRALGCRCQVNVSSILNKRNHKMIDRMIENDYIDYIASDCHNADTRPPCILSGYKHILQRYGQSTVQKLYKNAEGLFNE